MSTKNQVYADTKKQISSDTNSNNFEPLDKKKQF